MNTCLIEQMTTKLSSNIVTGILVSSGIGCLITMISMQTVSINHIIFQNALRISLKNFIYKCTLTSNHSIINELAPLWIHGWKSGLDDNDYNSYKIKYHFTIDYDAPNFTRFRILWHRLLSCLQTSPDRDTIIELSNLYFSTALCRFLKRDQARDYICARCNFTVPVMSMETELSCEFCKLANVDMNENFIATTHI